MNTTAIVFTVLAFGLGTGIAWVQARRRMRAQARDQLVALAEERIKQELVKRIAGQAARDLAASASDQARRNSAQQDSTHEQAGAADQSVKPDQ